MQLMLIAASARAMAESAGRAGFDFQAMDQFGDWDLRRICASGSNPHRPFHLMGRGEQLDERFEWPTCDAAIIGGGFENRIELVRRLEERIPLLGPSSAQLRRLQTTDTLEKTSLVIAEAGGQFPETCQVLPIRSVPADWLRKKLGGSGGQHVSVASEEDLLVRKNQVNSQYYFQRRISGDQFSAVFAASHADAGDPACQLIGVSRQLVGEKFSGGKAFSYCGSIGPISVGNQERNVIQNIGHSLSTEFGITGIFGIDLIVNADGIWPVDFNPRIPASAEIFELASLNTSSTISFSVIRTHVELTLQRVIPAISQSKRNQMIGKSILFCHHPEGMVFDERKFQQALKFYRHGDGKLKQPAWISDIPQLGTRIPFQEPIMSLFVRGATEPQVFQRLRRFAAQVR